RRRGALEDHAPRGPSPQHQHRRPGPRPGLQHPPGSAGQDWYGHHAGQVAMVSALAAFAPLAAPFFLSNIARKVEGHRFFISYTLRTPARIAGRDARRRSVDEPFRSGRKTLPTLAANYLAGATGYMPV